MIYLAKQTEPNFASFKSAINFYVSLMPFLNPAIEIVGVETVAKALNKNYDRYIKVFRDLHNTFEAENIDLLREIIVFLPVEDRLNIITTLTSVVNRKKNLLSNEAKSPR